MVLRARQHPFYCGIDRHARGARSKLGSYRIVGLDISKSFVRIATENAQKAGVEVTFQQGNASAMPFEANSFLISSIAAMPFEANSFDFIYCRDAFKNFSEPVQALDEMCRVLKPGGKAVINDMRSDGVRQNFRAALSCCGQKSLPIILPQAALG